MTMSNIVSRFYFWKGFKTCGVFSVLFEGLSDDEVFFQTFLLLLVYLPRGLKAFTVVSENV